MRAVGFLAVRLLVLAVWAIATWRASKPVGEVPPEDAWLADVRRAGF